MTDDRRDLTFFNFLTKMDFETYWTKIRPDAKYDNRKSAARAEWQAHPEKHESIMSWLNKHGPYPERNPFFFIHDWTVRSKNDKPAGEPTNWNNRALKDGVKYVSALYNGQWGMYTEEDVKKFNLKTAQQ